MLRRGLVLLVIALPPLVWSLIPPNNGGPNFAWLPPVAGALVAVVLAVMRWWLWRTPLLVAAASGAVVTSVMLIPGEPGMFMFGAILAYPVMALAASVAFFVPFRRGLHTLECFGR